jgi:arabinofuranan 3-O-arabinosyltransferase
VGVIAVLAGIVSSGWAGCAVALAGLFTASALERRGQRVSPSWVVAGSLAAAGLCAASGSALAAHLPLHEATAVLAEPLRGWVAQLLCLPALVSIVLALPSTPRRRPSPAAAQHAPSRAAARPQPDNAEEAP